MQLKVVSPYRAGQVFYPEGQIIHVTEAEAAFLMRDAPGCFEVYELPAPKKPRTTRAKAPNKMITPDDVSKKDK
jgi:hypothetical protein